MFNENSRCVKLLFFSCHFLVFGSDVYFLPLLNCLGGHDQRISVGGFNVGHNGIGDDGGGRL